MTGTCSKYEFESLSLNQLQKRTELLPLADFVIKKLHGFSSLIFSAQLFRLDFDPELNFCFTTVNSTVSGHRQFRVTFA